MQLLSAATSTLVSASCRHQHGRPPPGALRRGSAFVDHLVRNILAVRGMRKSAPPPAGPAGHAHASSTTFIPRRRWSSTSSEAACSSLVMLADVERSPSDSGCSGAVRCRRTEATYCSRASPLPSPCADVSSVVEKSSSTSSSTSNARARATPAPSPTSIACGGLFSASGVRWLGRRRQRLFERYWLEYEPIKQWYVDGDNAGVRQSPRKKWNHYVASPRYKAKWVTQERYRYYFRKNGSELDVPKWGG